MLLELLASLVLHCTEKDGLKLMNEAGVASFPGSPHVFHITSDKTLGRACEQGQG